ncbi:MAG: phytanoyl-CoA dioxygenase family protein [Thaumarchaeota archaeon]|nr:phytanoyl-CoA dioxygenase family protein [Nitrososphaerota archaeon]
MEVSNDEKRQFVREGFVIRRGFVSQALTEPAKRLVEQWYRNSYDASNIEKYTQKTFAPDLGSHPDLLNVYRSSGLAEATASLVSPDHIQAVSTVQVQIRVPDSALSKAQPEKTMHVDGVSCPHLDPRELRTFTLIAGVLLSDVKDANGGALRFVPGGHVDMAEWFRNEWALGASDQVPDRVSRKPSVPFVGKTGDLIIMHHLVPHAVGSNSSGTPRIMLYFRVKHVEHEKLVLDALRDPWVEYPELRKLALQTQN